MGFYKKVDINVDFASIEKSILSFWKQNNTFRKSIVGEKSFIFYDGPPFANGLPHYGHLLTGYIKDTIARYHTMKGEKVERRFGWDCHGLPAEMDVEKTLGISGRKAIQEYGVDNFNAKCRSTVLKYTKEWEEYVTRQGRWVDFQNDYKTMDISYMETVIWLFKQLYNKGLIYRSMRVMPYSWACETPVSDFETKMDNCYREKKSQSVTVTFKLDYETLPDSLRKHNTQDVRMLVWTTTPWTLPSNLALAVHGDIEYAVVMTESNVAYILAYSCVEKYKNFIGSKIVLKLYGRDIAKVKYQPMFNYYSQHKNAFHVLLGEFVTTEDGTGIVHIAPGFGEDDYEICIKHNIEMVCPVDDKGCFDANVSDYAGRHVFDTNNDIIRNLKERNLVISVDQYIHNYPHCWRTDTPLIYRAISSWYVKVTAIKESLIRNNQRINWIPGHIKDNLFGKWLENVRDWSISRNRYWGCPIPIWMSDDEKYPHIEVYGSIKEIEESFGVKIETLHKPFIDTLTKPNPADPSGKSKLIRVPDVLDCWFESGAMPYAQLHYPFENKEYFEKNFPADFIVEYIAQTRGWFYTLHVLSCALFDKPAFLNCICHGVLLGENKQKLSKRAKNYIDPLSVFEKFGADAMRFFMLNSNVMYGQAMVIDANAECVMNVMKNVVKPIWSAYYFFTLYANIDRVMAKFAINNEGKINDEIKNSLDYYIIYKCMQTASLIDQNLAKYETVPATKALEELVDVLNNWYIRRSRERFWQMEKSSEKISAYNALYTALRLICISAAPLMPFISEYIYKNLEVEQSQSVQQPHIANEISQAESVHLLPFPEFKSSNIDLALINKMERVREACHKALHIRNKLRIRIRQPLANVTFIGVVSGYIEESLRQIILDEINVHNWNNLPLSEIDKYAHIKIQLNPKEIAKRLGDKVQDIIRAVKSGNWEKDSYDNIIVSGEKLLQHEYNTTLCLRDEFQNAGEVLDEGRGIVILDTNITDELANEGVVRDIVRFIQQMRKELDFNVTDHIDIIVATINLHMQNAPQGWQAQKWISYIKTQTLSMDVIFWNKKNPDEKIAGYDISRFHSKKHQLDIAQNDGEAEIEIYIKNSNP